MVDLGQSKQAHILPQTLRSFTLGSPFLSMFFFACLPSVVPLFAPSALHQPIHLCFFQNPLLPVVRMWQPVQRLNGPIPFLVHFLLCLSAFCCSSFCPFCLTPALSPVFFSEPSSTSCQNVTTCTEAKWSYTEKSRRHSNLQTSSCKMKKVQSANSVPCRLGYYQPHKKLLHSPIFHLLYGLDYFVDIDTIFCVLWVPTLKKTPKKRIFTA